MIEFKDIAGLSEPLKRLIEVVAEGVGGISRPILARKNADAKAHEIRTIAEVIAESQRLLGPMKYNDGVIAVESANNKEAAELPDAKFEQRVTSRMAYQEAKRQSNLERITQNAAGEFDGNERLGAERPDSDWTARFFRIAEDITTDQMQALWGKVLAGEVKRPGTFSLRTLDILKNISQKEAEVFVQVARIAIVAGDRAFVPNTDRQKSLEQHFGIGFVDLLLLREIGLLAPTDLEYSLFPAKEDSQSVFSCGSTCILVNRPSGTPKQSVKAIVFTEIGKELLQLVECVPADPAYIQRFAALFQQPGVVVKSGRITEWLDDGFRHTNLVEVPGNKPNPDQEEKPNQ